MPQGAQPFLFRRPENTPLSRTAGQGNLAPAGSIDAEFDKVPPAAVQGRNLAISVQIPKYGNRSFSSGIVHENSALVLVGGANFDQSFPYQTIGGNFAVTVLLIRAQGNRLASIEILNRDLPLPVIIGAQKNQFLPF